MFTADDDSGTGGPDLLDRLGKHKTGKSCLYVNKLEDIDVGVLREMIRRGWEDSVGFGEVH